MLKVEINWKPTAHMCQHAKAACRDDRTRSDYGNGDVP